MEYEYNESRRRGQSAGQRAIRINNSAGERASARKAFVRLEMANSGAAASTAEKIESPRDGMPEIEK